MLARWRKDETVNPIIVAYTQTMRWLIGASVQECSSRDGQLWICELHMDERKAWMVWNVRETIRWSPPAEWHAVQYETLDARLVKLDADSAIAVGQSPLLVKSDAVFWSGHASLLLHKP